jgi:signal transduction histidine kinase
MALSGPDTSRTRPLIPSPWDGRLVAVLAGSYLLAFIFVFTELFRTPHAASVLGAVVISAVQVFICVVVAALLVPRPRNRRYGWLILGLGGFITAINVLTATAGLNSAVHSVVRSPLFFLAIIALALFDTGRLQSWIDRRLTLPLSGLAVLAYVGLLLVAPRLPGGAVGLDCTGPCPITNLNVVDAPGLATFCANAYLGLRTLALLAAAAALVHRYRTSGGTFRVMMRPVAWIGVLYMLAGALAGIIDLANLGDDALSAINPLLFVTRIAAPIAIGAGVLLGEQRRGGTLERDFAAIRAANEPVEVERHLKSLLHDHSLRVILSSDNPPAGGSALTELRAQDGRLIATLAHRPGLEADQPVAFSIAVPAATLSLEHMELESQMIEMETRLADARRKAVLAGDTERKRIEQDLHDGAQLRIILLRGRIERLARRTATDDASSQAEMDTMLRDADELLAEIRTMSAGMRRVPPGQLTAALRDLAAAAPLRTRVNARDLGTMSPDVEQALFYCVSEALQNAAKHAGVRASVVIDLSRDGDDITMAVSDDGSGLATDAEAGRGLVGMDERLSALGGSMEPIAALPFGGTTVRGRVPAHAVLSAREPSAPDA